MTIALTASALVSVCRQTNQPHTQSRPIPRSRLPRYLCPLCVGHWANSLSLWPSFPRRATHLPSGRCTVGWISLRSAQYDRAGMIASGCHRRRQACSTSCVAAWMSKDRRCHPALIDAARVILIFQHGSAQPHPSLDRFEPAEPNRDEFPSLELPCRILVDDSQKLYFFRSNRQYQASPWL
jgi:hypothetical protein